ncbi:MAG: hypothetical protein U5O39_11340 [Gammaproteobacteria bacterium]|nr:hypothetical protein [Gammaproteobacteria bacterium]
MRARCDGREKSRVPQGDAGVCFQETDAATLPTWIEDGCFDEIFKGCHGVAHVSHVSDYSDMDYVKRVCGHIIKSVNEAGTVSRVVVTSSIAAVLTEGDHL